MYFSCLLESCLVTEANNCWNSLVTVCFESRASEEDETKLSANESDGSPVVSLAPIIDPINHAKQMITGALNFNAHLHLYNPNYLQKKLLTDCLTGYKNNSHT